MFCTCVRGERSRNSALPASVRGSPTRRKNCSFNDSQYGGIEDSSVLRFDGATTATPQANRSGVLVTPHSVA